MEYFVEKLCIEPGCFAYREGSTERCASHNFASRKAERLSSAPHKERKAIKKVSDKRKVQNSLYLPSAKSWLIGKRCAVCGDPAVEVHHKIGKENELLNEKKYWLPVCRSCHTLITEDSAFAIREGYSIPRNQIKV